MIRRVSGLLAGSVAALLLLTSCGEDEPAADPDRIVLAPPKGGHTHAPGQGHEDKGPAGEGLRAQADGYRMSDVRLTRPEGRSGVVSFRILDSEGEPVTSYVEEQTKLLHLYVVRNDLAEFRHLHPSLDGEGTWSAEVSLASPGDYRVVAEFQPKDDDSHLALAQEVTVPGRWRPVSVPTGSAASRSDDGSLAVRFIGKAETSSNGRMRLRVSTTDGKPVNLGSYLGAYAHVSGFHTGSGRFVHTHPFGTPKQTADGTVLTFHTTFTEAGDYRFFVQARVDGFVHQVPVTISVTGQ